MMSGTVISWKRQGGKRALWLVLLLLVTVTEKVLGVGELGEEGVSSMKPSMMERSCSNC